MRTSPTARSAAIRLLALGVLATAALAASGQAWAKGSPATPCTGPFGGSAEELVVPAGATCTLEGTAVVKRNVMVQPGGSLIDQGAEVGGSINANQPVAIQIGAAKQSVVGHDVKIQGLTGSNLGADNYICNANIGHDLHAEHSAATAAPSVIGDAPDCSAGDVVGHDIHSQSNAVKVDVSSSSAGHDIHVQNNTAGVNVSNTSSTHDLHVQNNSGGVVVSNNSAGHNAKCSGNKPSTEGEGNTQTKGRPKGCPAAPLPPQVKDVDPDKGKTEGGTAVTIEGSGFTGAEKVMFGSTEVAFTFVSDKEITTTSPAAAEEGTVDVTVTTPAGTSAKSGGDHFTYKNH
jgi:hypothetical protein